MGRQAKLTYTSNPEIKPYIGEIGELERNVTGGYSFYMPRHGKTLTTSSIKEHSVLGDVNVPICRNIGFETNSGSAYQFAFLDIEKVVDGSRRVDNRFVGFEQDYKRGDVVFNPAGTKGIVIGVDYANCRSFPYQVSLETGATCYYSADQLQKVGPELDKRLQSATVAAQKHNESHQGFDGRAIDDDFGKF